ncbi:MAG: hypothetical protein J2P57_21080 [Acidimicrobiaceae bacterium]|nr:hypothetical protein [Acidimicrobiaceae bacterium]
MTVFIRPSGHRALGSSWRWRRTVRRVLGEHHADTQDQLGRCLNRPVREVVAHPGAGLTVVISGYQLYLADVGAVAQAGAVALSRSPCQLTAAGRYGQFWWLTIAESAAAEPPRRATALGSRLSIVQSGAGTPPRWPEHLLGTRWR